MKIDRFYILLLSFIGIPLGFIITITRGLSWNILISLVIICLSTAVFAYSAEKPILWLVLMILFLAIFPNSSIIGAERIYGEESIRLFARYLGGIINIWDILLIILLAVVFFQRKRVSLINCMSGVSRWLIPIFCIWLFGIFNGFIRATILPYGETNIRGVIQGALPPIYLILTYLSATQVILRYRDADYVIRALYMCAIIVLFIGGILFAAIIEEYIHVRPGFLGIPIVIYDQLRFLSPVIGFIFIKNLLGQRQSKLIWIIFAFCIFFMIISTRRLTYIYLVFNLGLYFILTCYATHWRILKVMPLIRLLAIIFLMLFVITTMSYIFIPNLGEAILIVTKSVNIFSEAGLKHAGSSRLAEIKNLFLNMNQSLESYFFGMGIGTTFYEFIPMGYDPLGGTGYSAAAMEKASTGWFSYFHLSFIAGLYRFGVGGALLIWIFTFAWFSQWIKILRRLTFSYLPYAIPLIVLSTESILSVGDSLNSSNRVFCGVLLAILNLFQRSHLFSFRRESITCCKKSPQMDG